MKRIRIIGLSLVAVFAMSALVAASASAESLPRYANCEKVAPIAKKYHGEYANKDCEPPKTETEKQAAEKDEGKYELTPWGATETYKVTSTSKKSILDSYIGGVLKYKVECATDKDTGELSGEEADEEVTTYTKCKGKEEPGGKAVPCENAGKETIKAEIHSELTFKEGKAFVSIGSKGPVYLAEFKCGTNTLEIGGSAQGEVKPTTVNTCATTITTTFAPTEHNLFAEITNSEGKTTLYETGLQSTEVQKGTLSTQPLCVWTETEEAREEKLEKEDGI